ncbi:MAG: hypothetical protein J7604_19635 [Sporocytophaga sp.]|uniref:hypothetical protein n=1 Tax=Sporocytophaga sp. TaxID=2231183 RepID=UPI001B033B7E|nr:hypothetical protein [Sporocytophaga sp.]MBO9702432.1 hypothetical protein [Sporocytophaga sp.]
MKDSEEKQLTQLFEVLGQAEAPVQTSWEVLSGKLIKSFWKFGWSHWNVFYFSLSAIITAVIILFIINNTSMSSPQVVKEEKVNSTSSQFTNTTDVKYRKDQNKISVNSSKPALIQGSNDDIEKPSQKVDNSNSLYTNVEKKDSVSKVTDTTITYIKPTEQKVVKDQKIAKEPSAKKIIIFADDTVVTVTDTIRTTKKSKKNKR